MEPRRLAFATSCVLAVGMVALIVGSRMHVGRIQEIHNRAVAARVAEFKACPDPHEVPRGCFDREKRQILLRAAQTHKSASKFADAGVIFAKLGMETEAREMAGRCQQTGDQQGHDRIVEELIVHAGALTRYGLEARRR